MTNEQVRAVACEWGLHGAKDGAMMCQIRWDGFHVPGMIQCAILDPKTAKAVAEILKGAK